MEGLGPEEEDKLRPGDFPVAEPMWPSFVKEERAVLMMLISCSCSSSSLKSAGVGVSYGSESDDGMVGEVLINQPA